MIRTARTYDYPANGAGGETVATLADGRTMTIDTRYGVVLPHGQHADGCSQTTEIGGRCDCGMLDGVDVEALVADARERGLRGRRPRRVLTAEERATKDAAATEYERSTKAIYRAMGA